MPSGSSERFGDETRLVEAGRGSRVIIVNGELMQQPPPGLTPGKAAIWETKRRSPVSYTYPSMEVLLFELEARTRIVDAAHALAKSGARFTVFKYSKCRDRYWSRTAEGGFQLKSDARPSEGIRDIFEHGKDYAFECATAVVIVLYKGILDTIGEAAFDRLFAGLLLYDWHYDSDLQLTETKNRSEAYPGDVQYFKNPDVSSGTPEWQGENVVKVGEDQYYGHGLGIRSAAGVIEALNKRRKPGSQTSAFLMDQVIFPDYGALYQSAVTGAPGARLSLFRRYPEAAATARIGSRDYVVY